MLRGNDQKFSQLEVESLFDRSLELSPEARDRFLDAQCGSNHKLRDEVDSLLNRNDDTDIHLSNGYPSSQWLAWSTNQREAWLGKDIGPYRILRFIAQGGMGAVFLAERNDGSYVKKVAIKLLDQRYHTDPQFVRRFRREQQTLANLDHPNITKLLDGGVSRQDVPYIIMEYVEGVRIDKYCSQHTLSYHQRLQLFRQVCSAVQYANQNLILHRDLKPSNILVSSDGVPKLLDFGISKVFDSEDEFSLDHTITDSHIFTPRYASPEQMRGDPMTTLSDVYSLGIILYELLLGQSPFPEPLSKANPRRDKGSTHFPIRPRSIDRSFPSDLETILLTAIDDEPKRRYQSASDLSDDILRFITKRPIQARSPSLFYQFHKLVTRHKWSSMTVSFLILCLVGLASGMTLLYTQAKSESQKANEVVGILEGVFTAGYADWYSPNDHPVAINFRVTDTIQFAEDRLNSDAPMNLATRYRMHRLLGKAFYHINEDANRAYHHLKIALDINMQRFHPRHPKVADNLMDLGYLETSPELRSQYFLDAYQIRKEAYGDDHVGTLLARIEWGGSLIVLGDWDRGEPIVQKGMTKLKRLTGSNSEIFGRCMIRNGSNYISGGYRKIGQQVLLDALTYSHSMTNKLTSVSVLTSLSMNAFCMGDLEDAEHFARRSVDVARESLGEYHPASFSPLWWLGHTLAFMGKNEEALPVLQQSLIIARVAYGNTGVATIKPIQDLAGIHWTNGNYVEAEKHFRELLEIANHGSYSDIIHFGYRNSLAVVLRDQGKFDESYRYFQEALDIATAAYGPNALWTVRVENNLARLLLLRGELEQAEKLIIHVLEVRENNLTTDLFDVIESKMVYGMILTKMGHVDMAECLLREAYRDRLELFPPNHRQVAEAKIAVGDWLTKIGQYTKAEKLYAESLAILEPQCLEQHILIRHANQSLHALTSSSPSQNNLYSGLNEAHNMNPNSNTIESIPVSPPRQRNDLSWLERAIKLSFPHN